MIYPLVKEMAAVGAPVRVPVAVACRVLGFSKQGYYKWLKQPVSAREAEERELIAVLHQLHDDDPEGGYRVLADDITELGYTLSERRVWRLCRIAGIQSVFTTRKTRYTGGAHGKPTVSDDLVIDLAEWAAAASLTVTDGVRVREPEDLVPVSVAVAAARRYARNFLGLDGTSYKILTEDSVTNLISDKDGSLWDALAAAFRTAFDTEIGKAGFAKELLAYLTDSEADGGPRPPGVPALDSHFGALLLKLTDTLTLARERENDARRDQRLERIIDTFTADHPIGCTRDRAAVVLKRIDAAVDDTFAGDVIHAGTTRLRREFKLATEPLKNVDDYAGFLEQLKNLRHLERLNHQGVV